MMKKIVMLGVLLITFAATAQTAKDTLNVPGPIQFSGKRYQLVSTEKDLQDTVQEYIPAGETLDNFQHMITIGLSKRTREPYELASIKTEELEDMMAVNPAVNFDVVTTEDRSSVIVDFLIHAQDEEGREYAEWNGYLYSMSAARDGVVLKAVTRRAYEDQIPAFYKNELDTIRRTYIQALDELKLPEITSGTP